MKRFINFGSIQQFRNIVKTVQMSAAYMGKDEDDQPVYNHLAPVPVLKGIATEKIHGTNAAVCFTDGEFWVQSRNNIITTENDNAGCAFFVEINKTAWMEIIRGLITLHKIDTSKKIVSVFFEWSGGSIQKNSAVSGLDKRAIIFQHFKVSEIEPLEEGDVNDEPAQWFETVGMHDPEANIFNVLNFKTWEIEIDFEKPTLSQNGMISIVEELEGNSPMGEAMGIKGNIGEGIVVTVCYQTKVHRFKIKGEKHSESKVKTLKPVDEVKEQNKIDFANYATPAWRLEQAWQTVFGIDNEKESPDIKMTGPFLKAVVNDVMKEEMDVLAERGLEPKEVNGLISKVARTWFMEELDKEIMGE